MELNTGDIVRVVDKPFLKSPAHWAKEMNGACGHEVRITHTRWMNRGSGKGWMLCHCEPTDPSVNRGPFNWNFCSDCFVPAEPEQDIMPASEVDMKCLFGLI